MMLGCPLLVALGRGLALFRAGGGGTSQALPGAQTSQACTIQPLATAEEARLGPITESWGPRTSAPKVGGPLLAKASGDRALLVF